MSPAKIGIPLKGISIFPLSRKPLVYNFYISIRYVRPFVGLDQPEYRRGGQYYSTDPDQYKAGQQADTALKLTRDERLSTLMVIIPSEDEEEEEEEMEVVEEIKYDGEFSSDG